MNIKFFSRKNAIFFAHIRLNQWHWFQRISVLFALILFVRAELSATFFLELIQRFLSTSHQFHSYSNGKCEIDFYYGSIRLLQSQKIPPFELYHPNGIEWCFFPNWSTAKKYTQTIGNWFGSEYKLIPAWCVNRIYMFKHISELY